MNDLKGVNYLNLKNSDESVNEPIQKFVNPVMNG